MTIIDTVTDKIKLQNYIENAKDTDTLILICERFLEKYKPDKKGLDVPIDYTKIEVDPYTWKPLEQNKTILTVSHETITPIHYGEADDSYIKKTLCYQLSEEIFKTKYVDFSQHKNHLRDSIVTYARLGVYKP